MDSGQKSTTEQVQPKEPVKSFRKGALVRVKRTAYENSLEAKASDDMPPEYIFQGPGEILTIKGEYAQLRWRHPVPDVWLRTDQLDAWH